MATEVRGAGAAVAATSCAAVTIGLVAAALVMAAHPPPGVASLGAGTGLFAVEFAPLFLAGALITALRPSQPVGWLLVAMGLAFGAGATLAGAARYLYVSAPAAGALLEVFSNQFFKLVFVGAAALLLLFPTGTLLSRRWRWLAAGIAALAIAGVAADLVLPGPIADYLVASAPDNPLAVPALAPIAAVIARNGFSVFALLLALAAFSLVLRYRRSDQEERLRLKWFALGAAIWAATAVADGGYRAVVAGGRTWPALPFETLYLVGSTAMATGIGIAMLRHRLFDVDAVIAQTVSFAALAILITLVYLAVVIGLGALLASGSQPQVLLAVAATALIAVAFQPARAHLDHLARRLVYGRRAAPYEALAAYTQNLRRHATDADDPAPGMARALAEGTACEAATVWSREDGVDAICATWPDGEPVTGDAATRTVSVVYAGEVLGRLAVRRKGAEPLTPTEERLMDGLALEAALLLKNRRLQRELRSRLDELEASRQRLVRVQDDERRRLERDLHDGAQQDLVALRMKLGLAASLARDQESALTPALDELQRDLGDALDSLRSLARGVYPPLLEAEGLQPALAARARPLPFAATLQCDHGRYPREVEGAVYFCCSEALQNVAKHAGATRVLIRIVREPGLLLLEVSDDGRGASRPQLDAGSGLRHIRDRLEALGGCLEVETVAGAGTTVRGRLPLPGSL